MAGAEHIPRPNERGIEPACANHRFAFAAHREEGLHHRSRLGHAEINEMPNSRVACRLDCNLRGGQIDRTELRRLGRTRMRHADEMNKRVGASDCFRVSAVLQRIGQNDRRTTRQFVLRAFANNRSYFVTATDEQRNKPLPDVTCAASNADGRHLRKALNTRSHSTSSNVAHSHRRSRRSYCPN